MNGKHLLGCVAILGALAGGPAAAHATGFQRFVDAHTPTTGKLVYVRGQRVGKRLANAGNALGLTKERKVVHVDNEHLAEYVNATKDGYLEVVVPAGKGHIYFRVGTEVFDFGDEGFRVGGVRPIKSDRYGVLVPLAPEQEGRLVAYLHRLKQDKGAELGAYDFNGEKGFHCASWMSRVALDEKGHTLTELLGGSKRDFESMPRLANFFLKRAKNVESVVVYRNEATTPAELAVKPNVITLRELGAARDAQ